jgi:hypothetical protein
MSKVERESIYNGDSIFKIEKLIEENNRLKEKTDALINMVTDKLMTPPDRQFLINKNDALQLENDRLGKEITELRQELQFMKLEQASKDIVEDIRLGEKPIEDIDTFSDNLYEECNELYKKVGAAKEFKEALTLHIQDIMDICREFDESVK